MLGPDQASAELVAVSNRKDPEANAAIFQKLVVLDGMPGINRV